MALNLGTAAISTLRLGAATPSQVMLGTTQIWPVSSGLDSDTQSWVTAVEAADGQALEEGVKTAVDAFIVGCKSDGIWDEIGNVVLMMGARTLAGALVPLKGIAPTSNNFVSGDYSRKTGIVGNASNKFLNTNVPTNSSSGTFKHLAVYITEAPAGSSAIAARLTASGIGDEGILINISAGSNYRLNLNSYPSGTLETLGVTGFLGCSRISSSEITARQEGTSYTFSQGISISTPTRSLYAFARNTQGSATLISNARMNFYSLGAALDLSAYDSRVSALVSAIAALSI